MGSQQKNASSDGISNNANRKGGRGKGSCQLIWEQAGTPFNILVKMGEGHYIQQELPIESPPSPIKNGQSRKCLVPFARSPDQSHSYF